MDDFIFPFPKSPGATTRLVFLKVRFFPSPIGCIQACGRMSLGVPLSVAEIFILGALVRF
jgi:hypothetical protein